MKIIKTQRELADQYAMLREGKNLSQAQLGKVLKVNAKTISFYENTTRSLPAGAIKKYAEFFNVTSDYLLGYSNNKLNKNVAIGREIGLSDEAIDLLRDDEKIFNSPHITSDYSSMSDIISLLVTQERFPDFCKRFNDLKGRIASNPVINDCIPIASENEIDKFNEDWIKLKNSAFENGIKVDLLRGDKEILRHKYNEVFDLLKLILKEISGCTDDVLFDNPYEN